MERLDRYFDTAFNAPEGIKKLREMILTLAMQGKLVSQDPKDQPTDELLKEIEAEKRRLLKEGKIKKTEELPEIKPEECPYELPQGWKWVRLAEIANYNGRKNIEGSNISPDVWVLDLEDIQKETSRLLYRAKFSERQSKSTKSTFQKDDVLYGKLRPYLDKVIVADSPGVCSTEIVPIVPYKGVSSQFLRWLLKRPAFLTQINSLMYGVKMPRLGTEDAIRSIHPLPPTAEQLRIVAKIDQLMARCDELEKLRVERERKRFEVHTAAIKQLLDAENRDCHTWAWQFLTQHFGELYAAKENVAELRKAILQLAVMGKLVPQNPNDSPASDLLKEIRAAKQRLTKEGVFRSNEDKEYDVVIHQFDLPPSWEWTTIQAIGFVLGGKRLPRGHTYSETPTNYRYLTVTNMKNGTIVDNDIKYISEHTHAAIKKYIISKDDLYITIAGTIGVVGNIPEHCDGMNFTENASRLISFFCDRIFLCYLLNSNVVQEQFAILTNKMAQPKLSLRSILSTGIPLPPLSEQRRIVAKIDQLMVLCDELDGKISATTKKQTELLNAVMAQVGRA